MLRWSRRAPETARHWYSGPAGSRRHIPWMSMSRLITSRWRRPSWPVPSIGSASVEPVSPRILVHSPRNGEARRYADLVRAQRSDADIVVSTMPAEAEQAIHEAEILLGWFFPPSMFSKAARLRWIHKVSAGVEDVAFNPDILPSVALTRTDGSTIAPRMVEYVLGSIFAIVQ